MTEAQRTWTTERIALLKSRIDAGHSCGQIAREIGVSRNAVIGKVKVDALIAALWKLDSAKDMKKLAELTRP